MSVTRPCAAAGARRARRRRHLRRHRPGGGRAARTGGGTQTQTHAHNVKYSLSGTVQAVDTGASTLTVLVKQSNRRARAYKGHVVVDHRDGHHQALPAHRGRPAREPSPSPTSTPATACTSVGTLDKTDPAAPVFTAQRITLRPALGTGTTCPN